MANNIVAGVPEEQDLEQYPGQSPVAQAMPMQAPIQDLSDVAIASDVPENLSPASMNPPPPDLAQSMVQQAIEAPTYDYVPDRQKRFDELTNKAKQDIQSRNIIMNNQTLPNQQSLQEAAEDAAIAQMLQEDQDTENFRAQINAEEEAKKAKEQQRSQLAQQVGVTLPTQVAAQAEEAVKQAVQTPSEDEVATKEMEIRQELATQKGAQRAVAAQQQKEVDENKKIETEAQKNVDDAEFTSLGELYNKGSFWQKLGASIAILAGGLSQGLTGAGKNPVLDFMDQQFDNVLKRRKLSADKEAAAKEALYKNAMLVLKEKSANLQNKKTIAEIDKIYGDLANKADAERTKQVLALKLKYGQVKDPMEFTDKERARAVRIPDGSYRLAVNPKQATELEKYRAEVEPALSGLDRVKQVAKEGMPVDLRKRAEVETELGAIVGSLRLPITGPGVLTKDEREMLNEIIGNPNKIFGFSQIENRKLSTIYNKLNVDLKKRYQNAGIDLPSTREEEAVKYLMQNYGMTAEKAQGVIDRRLAR